MDFDETIHKLLIKKTAERDDCLLKSAAHGTNANLECMSWTRVRHIRRRQEKGESGEEEEGQLDQQASQLEDVHNKLANAMVVVNLSK